MGITIGLWRNRPNEGKGGRMMIDTIGIIAARVIMGEVGGTGEGIGKGNRERRGEKFA